MNLESNEISVIADEYVLGLLEDGDRAYVEAEIELNAALKQAVAEAYERFLPLDTGLAPTDVSPSLWNAISSRLTEQQRTSLAIAANPAKAVNDNHRSGWRAAAVSAIAASIVLAIGLTWSITRQVEPLVVAVLMNEAGEVQAVVEDFGNDSANVRLLTDFTVPDDKTMHMWTAPGLQD